MQKQSGFSPLIIILAIAILVVAGVAGWRVWEAGKATRQTNQTQNNSQQNIQSIKDPNEGYVVIKEWGVRFKPVEGLEGVSYYTIDSEGSNTISFTTKKLGELDANCSPASRNIVLGTLTRTKDTSGQGKSLGPIGGYYYYTRGPQAACSTKPNELEGPSVIKLLKSLESLELTQ